MRPVPMPGLVKRHRPSMAPPEPEDDEVGASIRRGKPLIPAAGVIGNHPPPEALGWGVGLHHRHFPGAAESVKEARGYALPHALTAILAQDEELADLLGVIPAEVCSHTGQDEPAQLTVHPHQVLLPSFVGPEV